MMPVRKTEEEKEIAGVGAGRAIHRLARGLLALMTVFILSSYAASAGATEELVSLVTRSDRWGQPVTVKYLLSLPDKGAVQAVLLALPGGNGYIGLTRDADGTIARKREVGPFFGLAPGFLEKGVAVAIPDVSSDVKGISYKDRRHEFHMEDLGHLTKDLRKRLPGVPVFVAGSGAATVSALSFAGSEKGLGGVILSGMDSIELSLHSQPKIKTPVLALHHLEDACNASPMIEAEEVARKHSFTFVPFSGGGPDKDNDPCSTRTAHGLVGLETSVIDTMVEWMERGTVVAPPLPSGAKGFLNEQVVFVPMKEGKKDIALQTTVFKPDGPGPFPLVITSHGVHTDLARSGELKVRLRYTAQSRLFVDWGFVVVLPMRRGYGKSGGSVNMSTTVDGFGLQDAEEIQAALDFLGRQPYVDAGRTLLVGHSGGGLASLAYGSLGGSSVKGIVNFAGGLRRGGYSPRWELDMIEDFGTLAKTTRTESIWFYAENDSVFPPDLVRATHEAYVKKGGRATLHALPAFKGEGHFVFGDPSGIELWSLEVRDFIDRIGIKTDTGQSVTDPQDDPVPPKEPEALSP